ncbi:MAG: PIN domain-containing protein [Deltaproteobacteria bacterium]|nr:PIN domain-containing protein [Deltaproteobacteria bacterium]
MILCDVSVLLPACMPAAPSHARCRALVEEVANAEEPFAVSQIVLAAVVRIATNPKVFRPAASPERVFEFAEALLGHERAVLVAPGPRHWRIFRDLVTVTGIRGSDTTDAYLAAIAVEHGCIWWTADRGFARFSGLRWRNVLE